MKAPFNPSTDKAARMARLRVFAALERGEHEYPLLAAPDGAVAVQIDDLRSFCDAYMAMQDTLALGPQEWIERWYGSEPEKGSAIVTKGGGNLVAYLGGDETTHAITGKIVAAHNASLLTKASAE